METTRTVNTRYSTIIIIFNHRNGDDDGESSTPMPSSSSSCQVCNQNQSRYVCPKCTIKYCSIECYQNHNTSNIYDKNNNGSSSTTSCTEEFYKKKVTALLKLENIENNNQIHTILNRYHHNHEDDEEEDDQQHDTTNLEMENELYELLSKLEGMDDDDDLSYNRLTKFIPASLKEKFQNDLQNGTIQQLVLQDWYPWWKKELVAKDDDVIDNDAKQQQSSSINEKTLDERFFEIPKFHTLSKKKVETQQQQQQQQQELLLYNLMDILYATIYTLRLYHGVNNACTNEPIEASMTLITTSKVLSKDTRYISLSEVLVNCTTATNRTKTTTITAIPNDGNATSCQ